MNFSKEELIRLKAIIKEGCMYNCVGCPIYKLTSFITDKYINKLKEIGITSMINSKTNHIYQLSSDEYDCICSDPKQIAKAIIKAHII